MDRKTCPYCGEEIAATARKCKHCGEWLEKGIPSSQVNIYQSRTTPSEHHTSYGPNNEGCLSMVFSSMVEGCGSCLGWIIAIIVFFVVLFACF